MTDITQFPIPTAVLDPAEWPEFKGEKGDPGDAGAKGDDGDPGADGKTVLSGAVDPTTEGVDGDWYINTVSHEIFGPKAAGTWPAGVSLIGPAGAAGLDGQDGADGTSVTLAGSVATVEDLPSGASAGDLWIVLADGDGYVSDGAGNWANVGAIRGPAGADGTNGTNGIDGVDGRTILSGAVDPTDEGEDGDFYLNTATSTLFGPKATTWPAGVLLKGADGTNGTNGVDGEDGAPGDAPPITTATITAGNLATPLDGSIYHVALTEDVDGTWTAAIPSGGNAATTGYYATVIFNPPGTGEGSGVGTDGPWIAPFPVGWSQVGGLDSISLAPGDDPVVCSLASVGDGVILVSAVAAVEIAA